MIDIGKILKRAWHILWNYRALWIFGLVPLIKSTYHPIAPVRLLDTRATAPVKAPRSCPNSSLSSSVSVIAAQLIATNGFDARALLSWMARATSSLPVPLSPVTSTVAAVGAHLAIAVKTRCIAGDSPTSPCGASGLRKTGAWAARLSRSLSRARSTAVYNSSSVKGFER